MCFCILAAHQFRHSNLGIRTNIAQVQAQPRHAVPAEEVHDNCTADAVVYERSVYDQRLVASVATVKTAVATSRRS